MESFIATDTPSFELFFNIFTSGIEEFVILWDQLLYPCVVEVCRMRLEPLWNLSPPLWWCNRANSCRRCVDRRAVCGHRPGKADDEFWSAYALCFQKRYHRQHFTVGGCWNKSPQPRPCNDATVRTRESRWCIRHATSLLYYVYAVASRNKLFTSCGTSGNLNLWTSLVLCFIGICTKNK